MTPLFNRHTENVPENQVFHVNSLAKNILTKKVPKNAIARMAPTF